MGGHAAPCSRPERKLPVPHRLIAILLASGMAACGGPPGKAEIVLMRLDDEPTYRVECWRSFAPYVLGFLNEAAREFQR